MAIQGVDTKCYILALFVRDDGERFLLGSGHYEFKDTQMHFAANAIQNDIVEVQGNDGFLLAGQVRRPGTQSFDGYVGDGTLSKQDTEAYRRQFFSFFRKNFFYKVIYVFSDGTAIQRKRGFLVDDPTVQELYQIYPEYHVALNFEDVNYYSYSEDDEGHEQYAKEATIDLSSMRATGGLEWDNLGVIWENPWSGEQTASGTEITIQNDMSVMSPTKDTMLYGNTFQQTYSGKNLFNKDATPFAKTSNTEITVMETGIRVTQNTATTSNMFTTYVIGDFSSFANQVVTLSADIMVSGQNTSRLALGYCKADGSSRTTKMTLSTSGQVSLRLSATELAERPYLYIYAYANTSGGAGQAGDYVEYTDFQLELNSTATSYEPYTGGIPAPNPDYPQTVQVATGEQTVTIGNGSSSQTFAVDLGSLELCKLGDYQDYIYKSGDDWFVHKEVQHLSLGISDMNNNEQYPGWRNRTVLVDTLGSGFNNTLDRITTYLANILSSDSGSADTGILSANTRGTGSLFFQNGNWSQTYWKTNYPNLSLELYYGILVPQVDTQITDQTLVGQLNALDRMRLFVGENNLTVLATGTNLPSPISFKYYTTVAMTGAVWEEGGSGGATVVEVDSITNIYPIWKVKGPAVNPELSVISTNTTIQYNGTITGTQTLEVDMFNKTAKLNGVSVIGNISGDWINFSPGTNRVIYTADNADALPSTIEWQEVVG